MDGASLWGTCHEGLASEASGLWGVEAHGLAWVHCSVSCVPSNATLLSRYSRLQVPEFPSCGYWLNTQCPWTGCSARPGCYRRSTLLLPTPR